LFFTVMPLGGALSIAIVVSTIQCQPGGISTRVSLNQRLFLGPRLSPVDDYCLPFLWSILSCCVNQHWICFLAEVSE
jgi:hypothetical protein